MAQAELGLLDELLLALFQRNGVHNRLALKALQPGLDHRPFGGIDHHRNAGDIGLGGDQIEEGDHRLFRVEQPLIHVDVDHLRASFHLVAGHIERRRIVVGLNQLAELGRSGDVGPLTDIHEWNVVGQRKGLQPGQAKSRFDLRQRARRLVGHSPSDGLDVLRRRAAAAANNVDQPGLGELAQHAGRCRGRLVIGAELIRQAGIRIGADKRVGHLGKLCDMCAHLLRAERAVEPDGKRLGMAQRVPEGGGRLTGQRATGQIGDRTGDHHRQAHAIFFKHLVNREQCRLGVQRIEDGLDQKDVRAAGDQPPRRFAIGFAQIIEGDGAIARVLHIR